MKLNRKIFALALALVLALTTAAAAAYHFIAVAFFLFAGALPHAIKRSYSAAPLSSSAIIS